MPTTLASPAARYVLTKASAKRGNQHAPSIGAPVSLASMLCESGEIDNTEHWLTKCDATVAARRDIFGTVEIDMVDLAYHPSRIIRLAERTLVRPATERRTQQA